MRSVLPDCGAHAELFPERTLDVDGLNNLSLRLYQKDAVRWMAWREEGTTLVGMETNLVSNAADSPHPKLKPVAVQQLSVATGRPPIFRPLFQKAASPKNADAIAGDSTVQQPPSLMKGPGGTSAWDTASPLWLKLNSDPHVTATGTGTAATFGTPPLDEKQQVEMGDTVGCHHEYFTIPSHFFSCFGALECTQTKSMHTQNQEEDKREGRIFPFLSCMLLFVSVLSFLSLSFSKYLYFV
jgi:hypothetical protein